VFCVRCTGLFSYFNVSVCRWWLAYVRFCFSFPKTFAYITNCPVYKKLFESLYCMLVC